MTLKSKEAMGVMKILSGLFLGILGFGSLGIIKGSLAAWFQAVIYGCCTPAGGLFALLTAWGFSRR